MSSGKWFGSGKRNSGGTPAGTPRDESREYGWLVKRGEKRHNWKRRYGGSPTPLPPPRRS